MDCRIVPAGKVQFDESPDCLDEIKHTSGCCLSVKETLFPVGCAVEFYVHRCYSVCAGHHGKI
jgi:hypothetical protein